MGMYLAEVKLWNFRKYGILGDDPENPGPGLHLHLQPGLNLLIGENDSGKTAIVDAIRYALGTQSGEWIRYEETDFHSIANSRATELQIECIFRGFTPEEAGPFLEWLGFEEVDGKKDYLLHLRLRAQRKRDRITAQLRAGPDVLGTPIDGEARERLRVTYLKPLRDAESDLTAGRRSRFAQILKAHSLFQTTIIDGEPQIHELEKYIAEANEKINSHFKPEDGDAGALLRTLNRYLEAFFTEDDNRSASVTIAGSELHDILRRLELSLEDNRAGLGTLNLLYIAAELLLLHSDSFPGLRLALIEELEAHLHPQAQLRLVDFLSRSETTGQYILTTHSTTLAASVDLKKLIICQGNEVFPMGPDFTELAPKSYDFLSRFLDATKANLFFAKGVILVEGDSENLLIPTIAEIINRPLHRYGVSIVNIGSTAFSHYEKVFIRKDGQHFGIKVAVVTDLDIKPLEWRLEAEDEPPDAENIENEKEARHEKLSAPYASPNIKRFISPHWTLEYEIALSKLRKLFYRAALWAGKKQNSVEGQPKKPKFEEVTKQVNVDFTRWSSNWAGDERLAEKIAFQIYPLATLDKKISKTILAQEFAAMLVKQEMEEEGKSREMLIKSQSLSYLIRAICHVTEPLSDIEPDEYNRS